MVTLICLRLLSDVIISPLLAEQLISKHAACSLQRGKARPSLLLSFSINLPITFSIIACIKSANSLTCFDIFQWVIWKPLIQCLFSCSIMSHYLFSKCCIGIFHSLVLWIQLWLNLIQWDHLENKLDLLLSNEPCGTLQSQTREVIAI